MVSKGRQLKELINSPKILVTPGVYDGYSVRLTEHMGFKSGSITVEGKFSDTGNTVLAITGGTGAYATARGEMDLKYHNKKGTEFDFVFHLR